jgi:hypothetical protein
MILRALLLVAVMPLVGGWADRDPSWPYAGPTPDQPVKGPPTRYKTVGMGTKSYRPVEPMPWGEVNKRVAPSEPMAPMDSSKPHDTH